MLAISSIYNTVYQLMGGHCAIFSIIHASIIPFINIWKVHFKTKTVIHNVLHMVFYFKHFDNKIEFTFCNGIAWPFCSSMLCQRWRKVLKSWCNNRIRLPPLLVVCKNTVSSVHCAELLLFSCKSTDLEKSESDFVKPLCSIFQSILNNMPNCIYV